MGQEVTVTVERLASGGLGLARINGRVVFLPGVLPGEDVLVEILETKSDYWRATPLKIIKPHPGRRDPLCPLFGTCGGCQLMHIDYDLQPALKTEAALERLLDARPLEYRVVPSPLPLGYRDRVRLQTGLVEGRYKVGFYTPRSKHLVPVDTCPQLNDNINAFLPVLKAWTEQWQAFKVKPSGFEILADPNGDDVMVVPDFPGKPPAALLETMVHPRTLVHASIKGKITNPAIGGQTGMPWPAPPGTGLKLRVYPGIFTQVNTSVNHLLVQAVLKAAQAASPQTALDLFGGFGNFSLPLAAQGPYVTAIEDNPFAVEAGRVNAQGNGLKNVTFIRGKAEKSVFQAADQGRRFDLAILDPPRSGAKGLGPAIARLSPRRILYVSCHPATLIRDLAEFQSFGYGLTELTAFDMFPYTAHIEVLAVLDR